MPLRNLVCFSWRSSLSLIISVQTSKGGLITIFQCKPKSLHMKPNVLFATQVLNIPKTEPWTNMPRHSNQPSLARGQDHQGTLLRALLGRGIPGLTTGSGSTGGFPEEWGPYLGRYSCMCDCHNSSGCPCCTGRGCNKCSTWHPTIALSRVQGHHYEAYWRTQARESRCSGVNTQWEGRQVSPVSISGTCGCKQQLR